MPDADDFDVEYFRNLMKGGNPKAEPAPPAAPSVSAAKKIKKSPAKKAATKAKSPTKIVHQKSNKG